MRLENLLQNIYEGDIDTHCRDLEISSICCDSRQVKKGSLFITQKGSVYDGADFIEKAIDQGARVIVTDQEKRNFRSKEGVVILKVGDTFQFLRDLAKRFYDHPSSQIKTIGVTGTNGKTTTVYLMEAILHESEHSCGVIGTVNYRIGERVLPSKNTTPGFLDNQMLFRELVDEGVEYCLMEVSSHALDQGRIDLIDFKAAVFTNLTSDHLDYHGTQENYFSAKASFFTRLSSDALAVINIDDIFGRRLFSKTKSKIRTYGIHNNADVKAVDVKIGISATEFKLVADEGQVNIRTKLVGQFNVYNILAAATACLGEGISLDKIRKGIENLSCVPGRLQRVECGQDYTIFIDYAHTQDALENVLTTIRSTVDAKIILVFGCGGNRDRTKRPMMGAVASRLADFSVVTSDNPRNEDPQTIIDNIIEGFENDHYEVIVEREEAIKKSLSLARKGDVVLIAGKGHETYQIFKDKTIHFDERQIIQQFILC